MSYTRVNWEDAPSVATPVSASNLNKMDAGIKQNADDIEQLQQHTYDAELNNTSTNAPQTKAVYEALQEIDIETDTTLSVSGKAADAAATGEAVNQLKSALSNFEELSKIELNEDITTGWVTKHYLNLNNPAGTVIIPGKINYSNNYNYIVVPVQPGDEFMLTGTGGGDSRLYGWLDSDNKLISKSSASLTVTDEVLIAEQVGYLAVNVNTNNLWSLRRRKIVIASATAYSLKDFGAVGDGVTDDTDAIQSALNNVKDLYVPNGTYLFSKTLFIKSGTHLHGEGALSVFQLADSFTLTPYAWREDSELVTDHNRYPMIMIESTESGCMLENFKLRGQTDHFYDKNCDGISVFGSNHVVKNLIIEKINFFPSDFSGRENNGVGYGIRIAGTTVSVENCTVNECGYEGIGMEDADTVLIENCNIGYSLQTGLQIHRNCQHIRVAKNTINCFNGNNSYRPGITLHAIAPYNLQDISITGNYIVSSLMFANGGAESDIRISDNFMVGINVNDFELSGLFRKNWVITGNTFTSGSIKAKCDNLVITNNMFLKNGTTPIIYAKTNKYLIDNNLPAGTASEVVIEPH